MADFDMDGAVAEIAGGLGLGIEPAEEAVTEIEPTADAAPSSSEPVVADPANPAAAAPAVRQPPKSWAKEYHEHWAKVDPKVQEYVELREKQMLDGIEGYKTDAGLGRTLKEVIAPYTPIIQAQGLDAPKAVGYLLNTYYRLTQGSPEQRLQAFNEMGRNFGFVQQGQQEQVDPKYSALAERQAKIEATLNREAQERYKATQAKVSSQVSSFADAKDPKGAPLHPYFDEVSDDIIVYINAGHDLEDAYQRAVYANPVTREKEVARLKTEHDKQLREKAKQGADSARKASSANVRSRDTSRAPTGLMGTMEDTMKEKLAEIKARTH